MTYTKQISTFWENPKRRMSTSMGIASLLPLGMLLLSLFRPTAANPVLENSDDFPYQLDQTNTTVSVANTAGGSPAKQADITSPVTSSKLTETMGSTSVATTVIDSPVIDQPPVSDMAIVSDTSVNPAAVVKETTANPVDATPGPATDKLSTGPGKDTAIKKVDGDDTGIGPDKGTGMGRAGNIQFYPFFEVTERARIRIPDIRLLKPYAHVIFRLTVNIVISAEGFITSSSVPQTTVDPEIVKTIVNKLPDFQFKTAAKASSGRITFFN